MRTKFFPDRIVLSLILTGIQLTDCQTKSEDNILNKEYGIMYLQKSMVDSSDIEMLLHSKKIIIARSDSILERLDSARYISKNIIVINGKRITEKLLRLNHETVKVYETKDKVKLVVYFSGIQLHDEKIAILRDDRFASTIFALFRSDAFILNQINEPFPELMTAN